MPRSRLMAGDGGGISHAQAKRLLAFYDAAARGESGKAQRNAQPPSGAGHSRVSASEDKAARVWVRKIRREGDIPYGCWSNVDGAQR